MSYEFFVGWRYLYSARRSPAIWIGFALSAACCGAGIAIFSFTTAQALAAGMMLAGGVGMAAAMLLAIFSTFTAVSVLGVAIGVSILIWVLSVTSGFQDEFRRKVLGVNAHILILKYGLDFSEYRDVMTKCKALPEVEAAAPFVFNEMMLARGQRLSGVLVKGVDPKLVGQVLDLPKHIEKPRKVTQGQLDKLLLPSRDASDKEIFQAAAKAGAVVLTKDLDFVSLVNNRGTPPQVLLLRCGNSSNKRLRKILDRVFESARELLQAGEAVVEITG